MREYLLSVVIPVYNEAAILEKSFYRIYKTLSDAGLRFEILYIDDGSKDGTWDRIKALSRSYECVKGIALSRNFGKESALCAGLDEAVGDVCVVMDCDLQHPPDYIPSMVELWENGAEVVEAVKRRRQNEPILNRWGARLFYRLLNVASGIDLKNASDFRLFDRKAIEAWKRMPERQTFFRAMSTWIGFKRESLFFDVEERMDGGKSRWKPIQLAKLAVGAITSFSVLPLQIVTVIGFTFLVFSFMLALQTLYRWFLGQAIEGFTTVILLLLIIGSVIMLSLGLIGGYVAKIYEEVKARPRYIVSNRVNFEGDKGDET